MRGMERRKAHGIEFRFRHRVRGDDVSESASPHGAPFRRFWARGPCFRMGQANPDPADFAAFISIPCSRERQSHVVGPDGDPADELLPVTPPGRVCARHARRRRILFRFKAPSRSAPREQDAMEYIPISENVKAHRHPEVRAARSVHLRMTARMLRRDATTVIARRRSRRRNPFCGGA